MKHASLGFRRGERRRWPEASARPRSLKPQKLFRATNSFYKAGCAPIPVISRPQRGGEQMEMAFVFENSAHIVLCLSQEDTHESLLTPDSCSHLNTHTHSRAPFLVERSLARSSLRFALESVSSDRGRAFSWGVERLCRTWDSSTWCLSALRSAPGNRGTRVSPARLRLLPMMCPTIVGSGGRRLALLQELGGGEGEPEAAGAQDGQHEIGAQPCGHLKHTGKKSSA